MHRNVITFLLVALMSSTLVSGAFVVNVDYSGRWSGTILVPDEGKRIRSPLHASFKHDGETLTGTLGPSTNAMLAITKGRVETTRFGTIITFDMPGEGFAMHFELRPAGDSLRGVAKLDGETLTAAVELQLVK
jgi:hypothetical protein